MGNGLPPGLPGDRGARLDKLLREAQTTIAAQAAQLSAQQLLIASQQTQITAQTTAIYANGMYHGSVRTGVYVTAANTTVTIDTTLTGYGDFWISDVLIRQLTAGTIALGVGTISVGTDANVNNIATYAQIDIGALSTTNGLRLGLASSKVVKVSGNTAIKVKTSSLISLGGAQLAIDVRGIYR